MDSLSSLAISSVAPTDSLLRLGFDFLGLLARKAGKETSSVVMNSGGLIENMEFLNTERPKSLALENIPFGIIQNGVDSFREPRKNENEIVVRGMYSGQRTDLNDSLSHVLLF